jgi:hypothetical protein
MSTIKVDTITDEAGSGAPDFPNGMTGNGSSLTGLATAAQGALAATALQSSSSLEAANLTGTLPAIDGSALTSLTAATLTGTLPAVDGSALTGVGSTDYKAVGTYVIAYVNMYVLSRTVLGGDTFAGSALYSSTRTNSSTSYIAPLDTLEGTTYIQSIGASGTWRIMQHKSKTTLSASPYVSALLVRIS